VYERLVKLEWGTGYPGHRTPLDLPVSLGTGDITGFTFDAATGRLTPVTMGAVRTGTARWVEGHTTGLHASEEGRALHRLQAAGLCWEVRCWEVRSGG
jgi:hypothetical protein